MQPPFSFLNKPRVWGEISGPRPVIAFGSEEDSYTFTLNSNFILGLERFTKDKSIDIFIACDSITRTMSFRETLSWMGGAPTSIAANKKMQISLVCTGPNASDVFATYAVQS